MNSVIRRRFVTFHLSSIGLALVLVPSLKPSSSGGRSPVVGD
jgi:hypothetical protein